MTTIASTARRTAGAALLLCTLGGAQEPLTNARPNIVLILADDLGYGDPHCYNAESKVPTPHLDALARAGLRCTDAHSPSSVCTPTRYGLLTGRYAWRTPLKRGVLWPWDPPLIEAERTTLPELLRNAGYATACIGKWHLGWNWPVDEDRYVVDIAPSHTWPRQRRGEIGNRIDWARPILGGPLAHGFDHYFGDDVPNFPPYTFLQDDRVVAVPTVQKPKGMFGHPGPAQEDWRLDGVMPAIGDRAAAWIGKQAKDRPFFLYVPLTAPHTPIAPTKAFAGKTEAGPYGDFVHQVDAVVGQVLAALERHGVAEDTLIVFTSDNGSPQRDGRGMSGPVGSVKSRFGHDPSRPWRGLKSDAWEGGHRVPFLVRWPGHVAPGTTSDAPMVHTDLYRTLARSARAAVPDGDTAGDSYDQTPAWLGTAPAGPVRDHLVHHSGNGTFAIRLGRWKLIQGQGSGGFSRWKPPADAPAGQLYDLVADPGETVNLYEDRPQIVARLSARLKALRAAEQSRTP